MVMWGQRTRLGALICCLSAWSASSFSSVSLFAPSRALAAPKLRGLTVGLAATRRGGQVGADGGLYRELGVETTATPNEIRTAYVRLAKKLHPDVSNDPGDNARFQRISEAYEVLSDTESRKMYDQDMRFRSFGKTAPVPRKRRRTEAEENAPASPLVIAGTGLLMISFFKSIFGLIA